MSDPGINQNKQKGKAVPSDGLSRELRILRDALLFLILVDFPSRGIGKIKGDVYKRQAEVLSEADAKAFISAICLAPNGVRRRNLKQDGFVVTSLNLGVARMDDTTASLVFAPRSSVASLQNYTTDCLYLLAETFGFDCDIAGAYPGWSFAEESPIRDTFIASYRELFDADLKIEAIHAGLECGLFSDALSGLDAIAVGPTIRGCHTPDEYLPLDSFERFYSLLTDVLSRLAKH